MYDLFSRFPTTKRNGVDVPNLTIRLDFINRIKSNKSVFAYRILQDGQRPEDIALYEYGDTALYWIILMINNISDPFHGWLLTEKQLYDYCVRKYGADKIYSVHHYENADGDWVNLGSGNTRTVTNMVYETELNESKRKIKILKKEYISQVVAEYNKELGE